MSPKDRQAQMRAATADVIAWQDHGDHAARARAIASVEDMIHVHAAAAYQRIRHLGVPREDLVSAGRLGAVIATDRFDRTRGTDYAAAASPAISEQVRQTARLSAGVVSPPDSSRSRTVEASIRRSLASGLTIEEAAITAGVDLDEAQAIIGRTQAVSFDQEAHAEADQPDPTAGLQDEAIAGMLNEALDALDETEAAIVRAFNIDGRPFTAIGPEHGFSGQRAGQIHRRAMARLRGVMRERGLRAEDLL